MIAILLLAIALSMDAFAVSIALGSQHRKNTWYMAIVAGLYFGLFQALMPVFGYVGATIVFSAFDAVSGWITFCLLAGIGSKMIYDGTQDKSAKPLPEISHKTLFLLAIATSIDALAAGVSLTFFDLSIAWSCFIIGLTTFLFSMLGVFIGHTGGQRLNGKAEIFGGLLLIAIGVKTLFS